MQKTQVIMDTFLENLRPELLDAKLKYIESIWGVGKDFLIGIVCQEPCANVRNAVDIVHF